jgi:hypothetical protein
MHSVATHGGVPVEEAGEVFDPAHRGIPAGAKRRDP